MVLFCFVLRQSLSHYVVQADLELITQAGLPAQYSYALPYLEINSCYTGWLRD